MYVRLHACACTNLLIYLHTTRYVRRLESRTCHSSMRSAGSPCSARHRSSTAYISLQCQESSDPMLLSGMSVCLCLRLVVCNCLSAYGYACLSIFVSVILYLCLSACVRVCPCLSVSVHLRGVLQQSHGMYALLKCGHFDHVTAPKNLVTTRNCM